MGQASTFYGIYPRSAVHPTRSLLALFYPQYTSSIALRCLPFQRRNIASSAAAMSHPSRPPSQRSLPASYWRGGTSRAIIFSAPALSHLSRQEQNGIFLSALGSPDSNGRQLDGLGAGVSSLSKICILSPPTSEENKRRCDVEYAFVAMGIEKAEADWSAMCGNMTSAVGPWAIENMEELKTRLRDEARWVHGNGGEVSLKILNKNTDKVITSTFEVDDTGEYVTDGDFELEGVGGTGAPIKLSFHDPAGAKTGRLLPTGSAKDTITVPGGQFPSTDIEVSCVDAVNPVVFVSASSVGMEGTELPTTLHDDMVWRAKMEVLRQKAAVKMGMVEKETDTPRAVPKVAIVSSPSEDYKMLSGGMVSASKIDLVVRALSDGMPHRALPLSLALCTGIAASLEGTVAAELVRKKPVDDKGITLGHPSGKVVVSSQSDDAGTVQAASVIRTARKIMEGNVFYKPRSVALSHRA